MINNWDIINRLDQTTGEIYYTLYIDGTEHDARLIAKKLKGYISTIQPAKTPYTYAFELPKDIDEGTQEKIRAATAEGVDLTHKIDQFIPGGVLGEPLFNSNTSLEKKSFPTSFPLDPSTGDTQKTPGSHLELSLTHLQPKNLADTEKVEEKRVQMSENLEETVVNDVKTETPQFSTTVREVFRTQTSSTSTAPNVPPTSTQKFVELPQNIQDETLPTFPKEKTISIPPTQESSVPGGTPPLPPSKQDAKTLQDGPVQADKSHAPVAPTLETNPISINESDMLIKDMEGSMLEKMPLENILSAETNMIYL